VRLNRREMGFLLLGVLCVLGLIYYLLFLSPGLSKEKSMAGYIQKREADLEKMRQLAANWEQFRKNREEAQKILARRGSGFTLLSFLEGISREVGIDSKIQYIKPVSYPETEGPLKLSGMEMKLDDINMRQLMNFLYGIEFSQRLIKVKRIRIQKASGGEDENLKVTLQVDTYS
jgi:hypothetical protein